jgi:hypothetical protein
MSPVRSAEPRRTPRSGRLPPALRDGRCGPAVSIRRANGRWRTWGSPRLRSSAETGNWFPDPRRAPGEPGSDPHRQLRCQETPGALSQGEGGIRLQRRQHKHRRHQRAHEPPVAGNQVMSDQGATDGLSACRPSPRFARSGAAIRPAVQFMARKRGGAGADTAFARALPAWPEPPASVDAFWGLAACETVKDKG